MTANAPRTVLVIDDNAQLAALMGKYLRRDGYQFDHASDGTAAIAWLARNTADLLLLNLRLPDMTGEQIVQILNERNQHVPFIVLAGHGDERQASTLLKRGALDYLMKDGTLLEMLPAVIKRAMEQLDRQKLLRDAEIAYEHLRRQHELILQAAGEGICGLDLQGRITFVNPAAVRLLGYDSTELLGQDLGALAERPVSGSNGQVRDALASNTTFRSHDQIIWRKDGSCFPVEYTSTPIRTENQQIGSVFVFKDVTKRRELEEKYRQSQKLEAVGRLAGGVAHDFNNLLTVVSGYGELLATNPSIDQKAREAVGEIQRAAERAIAVTRKLLAFSRKTMLRPQRLDLNAVITEITKLIRRLIGEDIELKVDLAPRLAPITADPGELDQVIINLAVNSRDAMPHGGTLTISTSSVQVEESPATFEIGPKPGRYALLKVADTGVGMDAETRDHVFEPFFTTKEQGRGTGLGLAMVHGFVEQSGGKIEVQSEPNRGTTFHILLPQSDGVVEYQSSRETGSAFGGDETILLVEDEESVRGLTARVLQSYGYRVIEASDGMEALKLVQRHPQFIHLMLSDVVMPGMSGPKLAERLAPVRPAMRVLFMSGYTADAIDRRGALSSEAAFLPKPFTPEVLARKVRDVLDGKAGKMPGKNAAEKVRR